MPRVFTKTKNRGGVHEYRCSASVCTVEEEGGSRVIESGQVYLTWKFNHGSRFFRHAACGMPRRSELSNSKMGAVWDAVDELDLSQAGSVEDIENMLADVATAAQEVSGEYTDAAGNIESAWPNGNPTSEACRAVAAELDSWASELEQWAPDDDPPDPEDFEDEDDFEAALNDWADACRSSAQDIVDQAPEYQG